ncbi:uncharacterized protein BT62DRAFT_936840 [Guyanagaster necrorhizus]|uniref:Uncharacterized protein n=1 Tax=Guyanagaster necrorhizus TaxID=856835 RepID=A0A9P7VJA1_9AGAR|nr:uncharacterized protein BT62DRAFT_936840 [Guyanagaster necrorhizus MCA 3950]KAG7441714.1 hypothetical protein BT62DRAFT_936840 [Guyanagaster necrorhizus MCA 3950]
MSNSVWCDIPGEWNFTIGCSQLDPQIPGPDDEFGVSHFPLSPKSGCLLRKAQVPNAMTAPPARYHLSFEARSGEENQATSLGFLSLILVSLAL